MTEFEKLVLLLGCKATLILGIVAALSLLVGRRGPQGCTTWLRFGVIALLTLPVGVWALPMIGFPVWSAPRPGVVAGEASASDATAVTQDSSGHEPAKSPAARSSPTAAGSTDLGQHGWSVIKVLGLCLAAVYGLVAAVLTVRFFSAWRGLEHVRGASTLVGDPAWQSALAHWSRVLDVRRPVDLRSSDHVSVPMTFGCRVPVILVPNECITRCDKTQREAILIHELTHIAQGDFFWHALTQLTGILYWMHPLVWLVRRQGGTLRERICDACCSQHLGPESYADALVRIASRTHLTPAAALGIAMAHRSSLRRRLNELQTSGVMRYRLPSRRQQALVRGIAALVLGLIVAGTLTTRVAAVVESDEAPIRLPETLRGKVVDPKGVPVAGANVTIKIILCKPNGEPTGAAAPKPWTASTDNQGRYSFSTDRQTVNTYDVIGINIQAGGFADLSRNYFVRQVAGGSLPVQRLDVARKIQGHIVDPDGNPVVEAVVRFYANSAPPPAEMTWYDTGPLPVDKLGAFSVSIPKPGKAAFVIYPRGFAPRIVDIPEDGADADLGPIRVERGVSRTGRVLDRQGRGVAETVVAIQRDGRMLYGFGFLIGTAVKTDETGGFTLPPVSGSYRVWVTAAAGDYSRGLTVTGSKPPPIPPQMIDFDATDKTKEIILREANSVTVQPPPEGGEARQAAAGTAADLAPIHLRETMEGMVVDQQHTPVAGANVIVKIDAYHPNGDPANRIAPKPWTATTDDQGRYAFSTDGPTLGAGEFLSIKIWAEGFVESSTFDDGRQAATGSLPVQRLRAARKVHGRIIDPDGNPVAEAVVRFEANSPDMTMQFDSGPLPVDKLGAFSVSIPEAGKAAFAVYPREFAPRIVDVPEDSVDLGPIPVERGTPVKGRVVDRQGHGVAGTVVAIQSAEHRSLYMFILLIGTAVKTDENGSFTLPPVRGSFRVWVTDGAPDYSRRSFVTGAKPPPILPQRIDFDAIDKAKEFILGEGKSVTVRGTVRRADGSSVPGVEVKAYTLPDSWEMGNDLGSARTDAEGRYALRLPAPAQRVSISIPMGVQMPDGSYHQFKAVGPRADAGNQFRTINFDVLIDDVKDADWVVDSKQ